MSDNYSVYIHTNTINNKKYIGLTSKQPEKRWANGKHYNHSTHFKRAIEKYGWDAFDHEVYASGLSAEEASDLERELISKYRTTDMRYGYNLDTGGSRTTHSKITKQKISKAIKGIKRSPETIEKLRNAAKGNKNCVGRHHTEESKEKNRIAHLNKTHSTSDETKEKIMYSQKTRKQVKCIELNKVFPLIGSAARYVGTSQGSISTVLAGRSKTAGGYHWMYYIDEKQITA